MTIRTLALTLTLGLSACYVQPAQTPPSTTATTSATPSTVARRTDPHFKVSDSIYDSCGLQSRTDVDLPTGTVV